MFPFPLALCGCVNVNVTESIYDTGVPPFASCFRFATLSLSLLYFVQYTAAFGVIAVYDMQKMTWTCTAYNGRAFFVDSKIAARAVCDDSSTPSSPILILISAMVFINLWFLLTSIASSLPYFFLLLSGVSVA